MTITSSSSFIRGTTEVVEPVLESDVMTAYRQKRSRRIPTNHQAPRRPSLPASRRYYFIQDDENELKVIRPTQSPLASSKPRRASVPRALQGDSNTSRERVHRRQSRMDGILSYELPDKDFTGEIRSALNKVHAQLQEHRSLINRYVAVDISPGGWDSSSVDRKYHELAERMPQRERPPRPKRNFDDAAYDYPFTVKSDVAKNSRMRIQRIMSRCRASG